MKAFSSKTNQYIAKAKEKGLKENDRRDTIIDTLTRIRDYTAVIHLYKKINEKQLNMTRSEISVILKKLSTTGIIERKKVEKNNHFVYKLKSLKAIDESDKYLDVHRVNLNVY